MNVLRSAGTAGYSLSTCVTSNVMNECFKECGNCRLFFVYMIPRLHKHSFIGGYAVAQLFEALRYKPEGRGLDSRWGRWDYLLL